MLRRVYRRLRTKWDSWHLGRDIKAGRILRGRQLGSASGTLSIKAEPKAEISMRVYRATTDTWEEVN